MALYKFRIIIIILLSVVEIPRAKN